MSDGPRLSLSFAEIGTRFLQLPMGAVDHVELPTEELA